MHLGTVVRARAYIHMIAHAVSHT